MSIYEQTKISVQNNIVNKFIPSLPYEVNKIILDKLNIEKQKYLLEKEFYSLFEQFIHNRFSFYTAEDTYITNHINQDPDDSSDDEWENQAFSLKKKIYNRFDIKPFEYKKSNTYRKLKKFRFKYITKIYNSTNNYELKKCIEKIEYKFDVIDNILKNNLYYELEPLADINSDRTNKFIQFSTEGDKSIIDGIYTIFKSNGAINKKQLDKLLNNVKLLVFRYHKNIKNILYKN
jgi:hypothetical protein